jgi:hypothetical protein
MPDIPKEYKHAFYISTTCTSRSSRSTAVHRVHFSYSRQKVVKYYKIYILISLVTRHR